MARSNPLNVGVVGAGVMGAGIAHLFARSGATVVLIDRDRDALAAALNRSAAVPLGETEGRLETSVGLGALASCELVIEAVPEDLELKRQGLASTEDQIEETTILVTNTSTLSIDSLADALVLPARFAGMHFFNPVDRSALIELVRGASTHARVMLALHGYVALVEKEALEVRDSPGFATSRLGLAIGLEAVRMVEEDVALPATIDRAMVLGYRFPIGPLRLTDIVGLDVRLNAARYLQETLGDRFAPPELLVSMVERGELGRKTGLGFYSWSQRSR